jgi:hypothetical protein
LIRTGARKRTSRTSPNSSHVVGVDGRRYQGRARPASPARRRLQGVTDDPAELQQQIDSLQAEMAEALERAEAAERIVARHGAVEQLRRERPDLRGGRFGGRAFRV